LRCCVAPPCGNEEQSAASRSIRSSILRHSLELLRCRTTWLQPQNPPKMSDDGNESDADITEETPPMPAPDAEGDEDGAPSGGDAGSRKKRRSGTVARAPSKAQTKMVHSCIVKVRFVRLCACDGRVILCTSFICVSCKSSDLKPALHGGEKPATKNHAANHLFIIIVSHQKQLPFHAQNTHVCIFIAHRPTR